MNSQTVTSSTTPVCPVCGAELRERDTLLHCDRHGDFFRYGPKLLVRVATHDQERPALLPWQTLNDDRQRD
jgi:hypothetical protein